MINGDRLLPPAAGGPRVLGILPGAVGSARPLVGLDLGGTVLAIPRVALPFLGHGLAPGLFETSALQHVETGGRLPVTVTYQGKVPVLPGMTITRARGGTAQGYLTAAGATAFGAALARQFAADHATGSYGRDGMFAGGVSVSLAGGPAATVRRATAFPMHTLTVTGTNLAGKPDTGDVVFVFDADNAQRYDDPVESQSFFDHGTAKFSVPAGNFWALGIFQGPIHGNAAPAAYSVIAPQITASRNVTVHMAARSADSKVQMVTPRPSVPTFSLNVELRHPTPAGSVADFWYIGGPLYFSPTTRRPAAGTLQMYVNSQLDSPRQAAGTPYQYNVAYGYTNGLIGSQRHVVRPAGLATVHAAYYSDVPTTGYSSRFGVFAPQWNELFGVLFQPMRVPRTETEYMTGNPAVLWSDSYEQSFQNLAGGQTDDLRTFQAGQRLTENWNAYPLHAGYNTNLIGAANVATALPSASRAGDALTLDVMPFSDSTLGHIGASGFFGGFDGIVRKDQRSLPDHREREDDRCREPAAGRGRPGWRVPHQGDAEPAPVHRQARPRRDTEGQDLHPVHVEPDRVDLAVGTPQRCPAPGRMGLRHRAGRNRAGPCLCGGADDDAGVCGGGAVAVRVGAGGCPGGARHGGAFAVGQGGGGDGGEGGGVFRWREELAPGGGDRFGR